MFLLVFLLPSKALAEDTSPEAQHEASYFGIEPIAEKAGLTQTSLSKSTVPVLIGNIVAIALSFVAVGFFILILYGGILWMTAAGNAENVEKAKNIFVAAAIGLFIVLSAYAITKFVFSNLGAAGGKTGAGGAASENAPAGGKGYVTCAPDGSNDGAVCGNNYVCANGGVCMSKCAAQYGSQSGECVTQGTCQFDEAQGLCPPGDVCCY